VATSTLTGAAGNNFGFYSAIAAGANRYNFYSAGTAQNYFEGQVDVKNTRIAASNDWNGPLVDGVAVVTVADGATITLTSSLCAAVTVHVYDVTSGEGGVFFGTYSTTVTKIAGDGAATDTGSSFAVYKSAASHTMTFKNKYGGAARDFRISVFAARAAT
jgi:predicted ThiF/HesA family dinucleotide-utilizing enzyme